MELKIGDKYEGGILFWISEDGKEGLVVEESNKKGYYTWNEAITFNYNNWRLPTKDELNKLYRVRYAVGGFSGSLYWSSTEYDANYAWLQGFVSGGQYYRNKIDKWCVRLIKTVKLNMKKKIEKWVPIESLVIGDVIKYNNTRLLHVVYVGSKEVCLEAYSNSTLGTYDIDHIKTDNRFKKQVIEEVTDLVDGVEALKAYREGKYIQKDGVRYHKDVKDCPWFPRPDFTQDGWEIVD